MSDLGRRLLHLHDGRFAGPVEAAGDSAVALVEQLAGWDCFADVSDHDGERVPFYKRAQIAASDLQLAGVAAFTDCDRLTLFADNLVPHVLRVDGVLEFDRALVERIERGALLTHGSPEEVEIRACAVHAVELLAAAHPDLAPPQIDNSLWTRGQGADYKARPRHRARCTAY